MTLRRGARLRLALVACAAVTLVVASLSRQSPTTGSPRDLQASLNRVVARQERFVGEVSDLARRLAADPDAGRTLAGDNEARIRLFNRFGAEQGHSELKPAMALVDGNGTALAWAGRAPEGRTMASRLRRRDVFIRETTIATSLVATMPAAEDGTILVEVPVRVRRNIANEFLRDFDAWVADDVGAEIAYAGIDAPAGSRPMLARVPPDVKHLERTLRGPTGTTLALLRITPASDRLAPLPIPFAVVVASVVLALLAAALALTFPLAVSGSLYVWAGALLALRVAYDCLLPPASRGLRSLLSSDLYATGWAGAERWLESPLDLLLAAALFALVAYGLAREAAAHRGTTPSLLRFALASTAIATAVGPLLGWVSDVADNTNADLTTFALAAQTLTIPLAVRVIQLALLIIVASALVLSVALLLPSGWPKGPAKRGLFLAVWSALGVLGCVTWWNRAEVPLAATAAFYLGAGFLCAARGAVLVWPERHRDSHRVMALFLVVLASVMCVEPALVSFDERHTRALIQSAYAPFVAEQPLLRQSVLEDAHRTVDRLDVLDPKADPGRAPAMDQLAFAVWSRTELSTFGLSSAVEIQDSAGHVMSRFALNLPALTERSKPVPEGENWSVRRELLPLGSVEQPVLHASRALTLAGHGRGAIHLYVSEDYWNLPFLTPRDPYSLLYRPAGLPAPRRGPPVNLFVFDALGRHAFYSTDRPPVVFQALRPGFPTQSTGFWTRLDLDGQASDAFIFGDGRRTHVLSYSRLGVARQVSDLLDAGAAALALTAAGLLVLLVFRTLLGRRSFTLATLSARVRERFAWRLLTAFVLLAVVPVGVLQLVASRFVRDRLERAAETQALQRAYVSQKAVEDYAFLQGDDALPGAVTDDALIYVASLLRSDLALFEDGRLKAASKRELYSSGLLPSQIDATAFRLVVLEGRPYAFGEEEIGGFSYRVLSLPVRLGPFEAGVLALPITFQGGVDTVVADLSRSIRLASLLFLVAGGALAYFMAWRISGPVSELTRAARQIAAGDMEARVASRTRDEIASLVDAFNKMAADLDRQRTDLEKSNRRAAWADMARQVAHEVKNPLTPIRLSAEHLRRVYKERPDDFEATLESCTLTILSQVERLRGIATEFSAFARPATLDRTVIDPFLLVRDALEPYRAAAPPGVDLTVEIDERVPPLAVERRLIERAFLNLVENAFQAVGERGSIQVRVSGDPDFVNFDVVDSGPGVDASLRSRLFEPFFSTKTGGTGLGLVLSRKIAEDHGGGVDIVSAPGEPTRIRLWLPAVRV